MEKGKYIITKKTIHHDAIQPVAEVSHLEVVKVYENGGKDVKKVIDVPVVEGKPAWDEVVKEQVFVPYTQKELDLLRIEELKALLKESDYKAIKYAEGLFTDVEYAPIKAMRQSYRAEINALEAKYL